MPRELTSGSGSVNVLNLLRDLRGIPENAPDGVMEELAELPYGELYERPLRVARVVENGRESLVVAREDSLRARFLMDTGMTFMPCEVIGPGLGGVKFAQQPVVELEEGREEEEEGGDVQM